MADETSNSIRGRRRNQWSLRTLIIATVFFALYVAIFAGIRAGLSSLLCTMLVAAEAILLSRRWLQHSPLRAAVIGVVAAMIHCGAFVGIRRAYYFFNQSSLRTWSAWQGGGGWPTVVGYTLLGIGAGFVCGLIVATVYAIVYRLASRSRATGA